MRILEFFKMDCFAQNKNVDFEFGTKIALFGYF